VSDRVLSSEFVVEDEIIAAEAREQRELELVSGELGRVQQHMDENGA
jgi:hypothetical protein